MISLPMSLSLPMRFFEGFLAHSLWMGFAAAVFYGLFERFTRRARPQVRYAAACMMLACAILLPAVMAAWELMHSQAMAGKTPGYFLTILSVASSNDSATNQPQHWIPSTNLNWLQELGPLSPTVVSIWALGVVIVGLRLTGVWVVTLRLQRNRVTDIPSEVVELFESLMSRLGITRPVKLIVSANVSVPMVAGWLRPIVILPISMLAGVDPQCLEAVLVHELAHIRRHDALINLLQAFAETLLFHHPAVWWLSARIREEREYCCDDEAAAVSGGAARYLSALIQLEESRGAFFAQTSMAATGGSLLARGRRLMLGETQTSSPGTIGALTAALVIAAGALIAILPPRPARAENSGSLSSGVAGENEADRRAKTAARLSVEAQHRLERPVTVQSQGQPLRNILMDIGRQSGLKIVFPLEAGTKEVNLSIDGRSAAEALKSALLGTGLVWEYRDGLTLQVVPSESSASNGRKIVRFMVGLPTDQFQKKVPSGRADTIAVLADSLFHGDGRQMDAELLLFTQDVLARLNKLAVEGAVVTRIIVQAERDPTTEANLHCEVELTGWSGGGGRAAEAAGPAMEFSRLVANDKDLAELTDAAPKLSLIGTPGTRVPQEFSLLLSGRPEPAETQ